MKKLPIISPQYQYIEKSFKEWLDVLGYAPSTVYGLPNCLREYLHYLEQNGKHQIKDIDNNSIKAHYRKLKTRPAYKNGLPAGASAKAGGGLSPSYLNKHLQALQKFSDYLRQSGRLQLPKLYIPTEEASHELKDIPTQEEIQELYKATTNYPEAHQNFAPWMYEALALRDKAMLTIFYGCGLRRNEGLHLDINDIQTEKNYIHVRKGKNYKERMVPISTTGITHLQNYLYESRPRFLKNEKEPARMNGIRSDGEAFFVSQRGKRIGGDTLLLRIKLLQQRTENTELKIKNIGLHTLRHSIATHLLQNGMKLESIARFLGHSSLESTQIYTHLLENENKASGKYLLEQV